MLAKRLADVEEVGLCAVHGGLSLGQLVVGFCVVGSTGGLTPEQVKVLLGQLLLNLGLVLLLGDGLVKELHPLLGGVVLLVG